MSSFALALSQVRYTNKAFWRNPASVFFTFAFPLFFLFIFTVFFGNESSHVGGEVVKGSTFTIPAISAFSVVTACFTNIAISVVFARDAGVLKRLRGTPLPGWTYLFGRMVHAALVSALLVAICVAFGALFYGARLPTSTLGEFVLTVIVGSAAFCAMGLAFTSVVPNADSAPAVINAVVLPLLFISNVFIPLNNPPVVLDVISKIFPIRHFADAMLGSFLAPEGFTYSVGDILIVAAWGVAALLLAMRFFSWEPRR